jgi:hypothetical protein
MDPTIAGWVQKLNCTISKGTGGRVGDGCLLVKSLAAGEMQAVTVASYPVTAGTTYFAFADAAGASSTAERIGIRWMSSTGAQIGITWSLSTMAASSSWHRVSVAGPAPAGATRAQVILSSTEPAGAVNHFWEQVYLGLPLRTTGNLLGFNVESTEVDASGWTPLVNATITRQVPVMSWSATSWLAGGHTLAMTAVAAGNAAVQTVDRPTVTPGTEYLAYAYLQPPVLSAQAWIELRFHDVNGNQVGAERSTLDPPGTGMYRQRVSAIAPASAATCSLAAGLDGASAGQVLRLETVVIRAAPAVQAGSVLPYADASFEQGVAGWTVAAGVATIARSTPWGSAAWDGSYSLAVTSSTATASTIRSARFPVTEGLNWRARIIVHASTGAWSTVVVRTRWYDAANADLGASAGAAYVVPGSSWYSMTSDNEAPAGATQAAVEVVATASAASSVLNIDSVALWQVLPLTDVETHSDDGYATLTLRELPLDYLLTVYRVTPDGSRTLVRGPSGLLDQMPITSDLLIVEDHEAPMRTPVYYRIELRASETAAASTRSSETVTLDLPDINEAWLKDPGTPQRNMRVLVQRAPDWQRPIEQAAFVVRGRRNKVVLSGQRQGLEGDLTVWTRTAEELAALHRLLDSGSTLLWQAAPGMGVSDMYVNVAGITEARVGALAQEPWRAWTLPLTEADMPTAVGVNGAAGRTWQDVLTEFATWQDVLDTYETWEDVLLDRRR